MASTDYHFVDKWRVEAQLTELGASNILRNESQYRNAVASGQSYKSSGVSTRRYRVTVLT
jgi:hypothetical protein